MATTITDDGTIVKTNDTPMTAEESQGKLRGSRDNLLEVFVDFFQSKPLLFNSLTSAQQQDLANYRQDLLDLPATVIAAEGTNTVLMNLKQYYPDQPAWFADKHPRGRVFPLD